MHLLWSFSHPYNVVMLCFGVLHAMVFVGLCISRWRQVRRLATHLEDILGPAYRHLDQDPDRTIDEVIDGFFHDIDEVITDGRSAAKAHDLAHRLSTKDEARKYLKVMRFERVYSFARTGIEAWPLAGILGTVLAISFGMSVDASTPNDPPPAIAQTTADPAGGNPNGNNALPRPEQVDTGPTGAIIRNFGMAIGSTILGLFFGVVFMLGNAWVEPGFERLMEHRKSIREAVRTAKTVLLKAHEERGGPPT